MSNLTLIIVYTLIGFATISVLFKLWGKPDTDDEEGSVVIFLLGWAFWPLIWAVAVIAVPFKLLVKWIDLLGS